MIHPKRMYAIILSFVGLLFVGCTKVDDETVATVVDAPVLTFEEVTANGSLESGDSVTFAVTLRNEGGNDSTGLYVYAELNEKQVGFKKTVATDADSTVTVEIPWKAVAGDHAFYFTVEKAVGDTSKVPEVTKLDLAIAVKKKVQKDAQKVTEAEKATVVGGVFGVGADTDDIFANIDDKIATASSDNEKAILEAAKTVADKGLKISSIDNPTKITYDDPSVTTVVFPLSKIENGVEVPDTTALFVAVEVTEEVPSKKAIINGEEVVLEKTTKKTTIPVTISIKEAPAGSINKYETIEVRNSLGGFSIDVATGAISSLNRALDAEFWVVMKDELAAASAKYLAVVTNPQSTQQEIFVASIIYSNEFAAIVIAYELQKQVTNEPPVISIVPSTGSEEYRQGNDLVVITWDIFTATVEDDKPGAYIQGSPVFNPGPIGAAQLENKTYLFTAVDSDGETSSVSVTSVYKKVVHKDVFIHDQGQGGN